MTQRIVPAGFLGSIDHKRRSRLRRHQGHHGGWQRAERRRVNRMLRLYKLRATFKARRARLMVATHG